jgi:protein gp37
MRVFSLAPILGHTIAELTRNSTISPIWPVWILSGCDTEEIAFAVEDVRHVASPVEFVVATENLLGKLDVWRPVGLFAEVDWFTELGLVREGSRE